MRILGGHRLIPIGKLPDDLFEKLRDQVDRLTEQDWQPIARPAGRDVIYFKYNAEKWNNGEYHYTGRQLDIAPYDDTAVYPSWYAWQDVLQPIIDHVKDRHLGGIDAFVNKCFFNRLAPQGLLWPHWDDEPSMAVSKRVHLVVKTNPLVDFIIDDQVFNFTDADLVEIDNIAIHSVKNHSNETRIHLVMDFYHTDFVKELMYGRKERLPNESNFVVSYTP